MATYSKIKGDAALYLPVGTIIPWSKDSTPAGFLYCNGDPVSRTTYADLFAVISTTFGAGDGAATFNLPNFEDRNLMGKSTNKAVGSTGGVNTISPNASSSTSGSFNQSSLNANATNVTAPLPAHTHYMFTANNTRPGTGTVNTSNTTKNQRVVHEGSGGNAGYIMRPDNGTATGGVTAFAGENSAGHNHSISFPSATRNITVSTNTNVSTSNVLNPYQAVRFVIRF